MPEQNPNLEILQSFLSEAPASEVISRVKDTLGNRDALKQIFFSEDTAKHYLPMLNEARKNGQVTYNTLTTQVEKQCQINEAPVRRLENK